MQCSNYVLYNVVISKQNLMHDLATVVGGCLLFSLIDQPGTNRHS